MLGVILVRDKLLLNLANASNLWKVSSLTQRGYSYEEYCKIFVFVAERLNICG